MNLFHFISSKTVGNHHYTLWQKRDYAYEIEISMEGIKTMIELDDKPFEYAKEVFDKLGEVLMEIK